MAVRPRLNVDALTRREMARERARITGKRPAVPSPLERAAQEWKAQQEQREVRPFERGAETSVVALQQVPLQARANGGRTDGEIVWRPYQWEEDAQPRRVVLNAARIGALAQHLRAREWARATGRRTRAPRGSDLEAWAERCKQAESARAAAAAASAASRNSRGR